MPQRPRLVSSGSPVRFRPAPGSPSARRLAPLERDLGRLLREFRDYQLYLDLGFVRFGDYATERLGMSLRTVQELIRVEDLLSVLPRTAAAFEAGEISVAHVRLLSRVATEANELFWVSRARKMSVRAFNHAVASTLERDHSETGEDVVEGGSTPAEDSARLEEEPGLVPLALRAPVWLIRWWRETVTFAGQIDGSPLPAGSALELLLAESEDAVPGAGTPGGGARIEPDLRRPVIGDDASASSAGIADEQPGPSASRAVEGSSEPSAVMAEGQPPHPCAAVVAGSDAPGAAIDGPAPERAHPGQPYDDWEGRSPLARRDRSESAEGATTAPDARRVDAWLRNLVTARQRCEAALAERLACSRAARSYLTDGFRSLEEFARHRLGLSPRRTYYLLSLNRTLERLPALRRAYLDGRLTLRQALQVGQVASRETTPAWIRRAGTITLRRLEDEVSYWELLHHERPEVWELLQGDPLPDGIVLVPGREPRLHGSTQDARAEEYDQSDGLDGPGEPHGSAYAGESHGAPMGSEHCPRHELHTFAPDTPGAEHGRSGARDKSGYAHVSAPSLAIDARSFLRALQESEAVTPLPDRRCTIRMRVEAEVRRQWREAASYLRSMGDEPLEEWEIFALVIRRFWNTGDNEETRMQRRRNPTMERDGWRCTAPGCRFVGSGKLHEHHIVFRSAGGALTDPANLTTLCTGHHLRLLHRGIVRCRGEAPDGLRWELGVQKNRPAYLVFAGDRRVGGAAIRQG